MASTSIQLPKELIERIDRLARESRRSRNRVIMEACQAYVAGARQAWPEDFFSAERLEGADAKTLRESPAEWLKTLQSNRHRRDREPF